MDTALQGLDSDCCFAVGVISQAMARKTSIATLSLKRTKPSINPLSLPDSPCYPLILSRSILLLRLLAPV